MGSKGFTCRDCGYSCHAKCEMKVPATCPGVLDKAAKKALKEEKRASIAVNSIPVELGNEDEHKSASGVSRSNTMTSTLSSSHSSGTLKSIVGSKLTKSNSTAGTGPLRRVIAPPPEKYVAPSPEPIHEMNVEETVKGKMLYAYSAVGEGEITVEVGKDITILEPDGIYEFYVWMVRVSLIFARWLGVDQSQGRLQSRPCPCKVHLIATYPPFRRQTDNLHLVTSKSTPPPPSPSFLSGP